MTQNNRPLGELDAQGRLIYDSVDDLAFRGEYVGSNLIYKAFAHPGADEAAFVWQIAKISYDGSGNVLTVKWPQNALGNATNDYIFAWAGRAGLTYS
jgi:hypothetical protein